MNNVIEVNKFSPNQKKLYELIAQQHNFRNANPAEIAQMAALAVFEKYDEGRYLFYEGDPVTHLFFIIEGAASIVFYLSDETVKRGGDVVGGNMISVYELYRYNGLHGESVQCLKDSFVAKISIDDYFNRLLKLNTIAVAMLDYMAFSVSAYLDDIKNVRAIDKILLYFKRQKLYLKRYETHDGVVMLYRDHYYDHIGEMTGCTRETVNRELKRLEKEGRIRLTKTHILLLDSSLLD